MNDRVRSEPHEKQQSWDIAMPITPTLAIPYEDDEIC